MRRALPRVLLGVLVLALVLVPARTARADSLGMEGAKRLMFDPANLPLIPAMGAGIGWVMGPALVEGAKGVLASGAIGAPIAIGMNLLMQNAIDGKIDLTRAVVSGLGAVLVPLVLTSMTGPAAPLIYMGVSMAGSFFATWALDAYRARQKNPPPDRFAGGAPVRTAPPNGEMTLLGVAGQ